MKKKSIKKHFNLSIQKLIKTILILLRTWLIFYLKKDF